jgi:hypothetical protein
MACPPARRINSRLKKSHVDLPDEALEPYTHIQQAARLARQVIPDPTSKWVVALFLSASDCVMGYSVLPRNERVIHETLKATVLSGAPFLVLILWTPVVWPGSARRLFPRGLDDQTQEILGTIGLKAKVMRIEARDIAIANPRELWSAVLSDFREY